MGAYDDILAATMAPPVQPTAGVALGARSTSTGPGGAYSDIFSASAPAVPAGPTDGGNVEGATMEGALPGPARAYDPVREGTVLEKFLNVLGLPNNFIAGAVGAAIKGHDPLEGGKAGIAAHTTFGNVLNQQGLKGPVAGALGLGLDIALDPLSYLGIGELTGLGKAAKAATGSLEVARFWKDAAAIAEHAPQVAKLGAFGKTGLARATAGQQAALSLFGHSITPKPMSEAIFSQTDKIWKAAGESGPGQALSQVFRSVAQRAPEALRAAYWANRAEAGVISKDSILKLLQPHQNAVKAVAKTAGVDYEVAASVVAYAVQKGKDPVEVLHYVNEGRRMFGAEAISHEPLYKAARAINVANAATLAAEQKIGLRVSELMGPAGYLKRAITTEARDAIAAADPAFHGLSSREFATKFGAQIQRDDQLRNLTISEINELGRAGKLSATGYKPIQEFFHEDPFVATAFRLTEGAEAIASVDFLKHAAAMYGETFKPQSGMPMKPGMRTLAAGVAEDLGLRQYGRGGDVVTDIVFPKEVAELLDNHHERVFSPQYMQGFLKAYDSLQGVWKALTLPIWPSYHVRNLLSDTWMITAVPGGMPLHRLPQRVTQAARALLDNGGTDTVRLGQHWYTYGELKSLAERMGVTEMGVGRDLNEIVRKPLAGKERGLDAITASAPIQKAIAIGNHRENTTRMAYFIERLSRGEHPAIAALETKKRLFQYSDLSAVERQVLRRVFPFYSWSRFNLPFQIQHLLQHPGYGGTLEKLREEGAVAAGTQGISQETPGLPQFLARGVPMPLGTDAQGNPRFARLQNIIPISDVSGIATPGAVFQTLVDQASPFPKAIAEVASNVDLFHSDLPGGQLKRLENYPGERTSYLGAPVPARLSPLIDLARPISEINRLNPGNIFGGQNQPSALGIPREQPDVSGGERLANYLVARSYSVDVAKQAQQHDAALKSVLSRLQFMLLRANASGDSVNAQVIQSYIDKLLADPNAPLEVTR